MKIGCIVQARATSSRLPGKVLKTLDFSTGASILEEVIRRLKMVSKIDEIIIATTINDADDGIVAVAKNLDVKVFRGSELDVLERYYLAAKENNLDTVIRITSDCPFIDSAVLEDLIVLYENGDFDYASNGINRTYPHGLDCEIFSMSTLEKIYKKTTKEFYREHVTSYIYTHEDEFRIGSLELSNNENYSDIRITVDTKQDYVLCCALKDALDDNQVSFRDILELYKTKPYLSMINDNIIQKKQYKSEKEELQVALNILLLQELPRAAAIIEGKIKKEL